MSFITLSHPETAERQRRSARPDIRVVVLPGHERYDSFQDYCADPRIRAEWRAVQKERRERARR